MLPSNNHITHLVNSLHHEVSWSSLKTSEEQGEFLEHYQKCLSQVHIFYCDTNLWLQREGGVQLEVLTPSEQWLYLKEYATLIDHPLKKHMLTATEDEWLDVIK
jgi:hypothetical protein